MTLTVMRRELDRDVRVAECTGLDVARAKAQEVAREFPDEEVWIVGLTPPRPDPPRVQDTDVFFEAAGDLIPQARVVSKLEVSSGEHAARLAPIAVKRRDVPWRVAVALLDSVTLWVLIVLTVIPVLLVSAYLDAVVHHQALFLASESIARVCVMSVVSALVLLVVRLRSLRGFLKCAELSEGVTTGTGIEVNVDGIPRVFAAKRGSTAKEGTRVHALWSGCRLVQLDRLRATVEADGEVSWNPRLSGLVMVGGVLLALLVGLLAAVGR